MTLNAESAFTAATQEIIVHRPVIGIVAGQTIHRLAVSFIESILADRVRKRLVVLVADIADVVTVLQHGDAVISVQVMTVGASIPTGVLMQVILSALKGIRVALATGHANIFRQKAFAVADMRIMTRDAGVLNPRQAEMIVGKFEAIEDIFMAPQTGPNPKITGMTGLTVVISKGGV